MNNQNVKLESTNRLSVVFFVWHLCPLVSTMTIDTRAYHLFLHLNLTSPCLLICFVGWQSVCVDKSHQNDATEESAY